MGFCMGWEVMEIMRLKMEIKMEIERIVVVV